MTEIQFKRLVAATDFSEDAANAALRAAMLASEQSAELELLHVVNKSSLEALRSWLRTPVDVADRLMADVRRSLADSAAGISGETGITALVNVTAGEVLSEILSSCERADMLALGARGNNSLRDAFIGTTAERLLGKCRRPILIVKRLPKQPYARVLVPLDFTPNSEKALRMAARVAPKAMIIAVHAYEVAFEGRLRLAGASDADIDGYRLRVEGKAGADISALWDELGIKQRRFGQVVERGSPALVIRDQQHAMAADLIVMGKHGRSGVGAFLLGSVTRRVLAESVCDVLVLQESESPSDTRQ